ncbi:MAG: glycosyltransferase family 2 protein, partial [Acidobacteria bacterium]|nr:glycosyltransferase family 2 protein [Acidobacteriota bacterium]
MVTPSPLISVVICTYNRCESLLVTLESLKQMSVPSHLGWELIIVDNNSSDPTRETIRSLLTSGVSLPVKYVLEPISGLSQARNRGIQESSGAIIAFLDDDVAVSEQWLQEVSRAFREHQAECIGGRVLLEENHPRPEWWDKTFDAAVGEFDRGPEVIIDHTEETPIGIGANIFFKRTAFERCGGFRTDMGRNAQRLTTGEETDMVQRLRHQGREVMYYPRALVYHRVPAERFS